MPDRKTTLSSMTAGKYIPFLTAIKPRRGAATIALSVSASRACPTKRMTTQLQLPRGERNLEAVKSVIGDWVVPLLVQEFLAEHDSVKENVAADKSQVATELAGRKK
jgi:hypothetical protein